jgi:biopolymer transport protein TolQ
MNDLMNIGSSNLSIVELITNADIVVKGVLGLLLLASVVSWAIILDRLINLAILRRQSRAFDSDFKRLVLSETFSIVDHGASTPFNRIYDAAVGEWLETMAMPAMGRDGLRTRLAAVMDDVVSSELDRVGSRLSLLATIGSVSPFVGLFGTVWGIMRSFSAIAESQNTSLAVVAPGIAEALFATSVGLFAAIPAVIGYNHINNRIDQIENKLVGVAAKVEALLSRRADAMQQKR